MLYSLGNVKWDIQVGIRVHVRGEDFRGCGLTDWENGEKMRSRGKYTELEELKKERWIQEEIHKL